MAFSGSNGKLAHFRGMDMDFPWFCNMARKICTDCGLAFRDEDRLSGSLRQVCNSEAWPIMSAFLTVPTISKQ